MRSSVAAWFSTLTPSHTFGSGHHSRPIGTCGNGAMALLSPRSLRNFITASAMRTAQPPIARYASDPLRPLRQHLQGMLRAQRSSPRRCGPRISSVYSSRGTSQLIEFHAKDLARPLPLQAGPADLLPQRRPEMAPLQPLARAPFSMRTSPSYAPPSHFKPLLRRGLRVAVPAAFAHARLHPRIGFSGRVRPLDPRLFRS